MRSMRIILTAALVVLASSWGIGARAATTIRVGVSPLAADAPIAIAIAKGYFKQEGLDLKLHYFHAQEPIALAVGSGDLDFGLAAHTAALFHLAADDRARIIASAAEQAPSFHYLAIVASLKAYAAGLKSPKDLPGHSFALTQMGTGLQYTLDRLAKHYGFNPDTVKLLPLQSNPNIASALVGGRADASAFDATNALPLIAKHEVKLLGWAADLVGASPAFLVFASYDMDQHHADIVKRFIAAYKKAARDYDAAFTNGHGIRKDEPTAPALLAIIAKFVNLPAARVKPGLPYFQPDGALNPAALQDIIDWYRSVGALKTKIAVNEVLDTRFVPVIGAPSTASTAAR